MTADFSGVCSDVNEFWFLVVLWSVIATNVSFSVDTDNDVTTIDVGNCTTSEISLELEESVLSILKPKTYSAQSSARINRFSTEDMVVYMFHLVFFAFFLGELSCSQDLSFWS